MRESIATRQERLSMPVVLDFVPTGCSIQLNQYHDNSVTPSISMRLRLPGRDNVTTPEGRSLNNMDWSVSIYRGQISNERIQALDAIGLLNYIPQTEGVDYRIAESCSAWAHLEAQSFDLLQTFVMSGRLPSSVRIHACGGGLSYGWEPDGSGKVWDVKSEIARSTASSDWVGIKQFEISLGVLDDSEDEERVEFKDRPVTVGDLQNLEHSISAAVTGSLAQIRGYLLALLIVSALIGADIFFR